MSWDVVPAFIETPAQMSAYQAGLDVAITIARDAAREFGPMPASACHLIADRTARVLQAAIESTFTKDS